jgi:hypothetical protein
MLIAMRMNQGCFASIRTDNQGISGANSFVEIGFNP